MLEATISKLRYCSPYAINSGIYDSQQKNRSRFFRSPSTKYIDEIKNHFGPTIPPFLCFDTV
jgi:hypothetical protein